MKKMKTMQTKNSINLSKIGLGEGTNTNMVKVPKMIY